MNKKLIEQLSKDAGYEVDEGFITSPTSQTSGNDAYQLEKFAYLVAEACALIAEEGIPPNLQTEREKVIAKTLTLCAKVIRDMFALD